MYRLFRRFERLAFGCVVASAVLCAGVLVVHRYGVVLSADPVPPGGANLPVTFALYCQEAGMVAPCQPMLADWKNAAR